MTQGRRMAAPACMCVGGRGGGGGGGGADGARVSQPPPPPAGEDGAGLSALLPLPGQRGDRDQRNGRPSGERWVRRPPTRLVVTQRRRPGLVVNQRRAPMNVRLSGIRRGGCAGGAAERRHGRPAGECWLLASLDASTRHAADSRHPCSRPPATTCRCMLIDGCAGGAGGECWRGGPLLTPLVRPCSAGARQGRVCAAGRRDVRGALRSSLSHSF